MVRKIKIYLLSILLFLFLILFLITVMFSIFDMASQSIKEFFNFGEGTIIANAEKLEELMNSGYTYKNGYEDYLNINNVRVYIDKEKKGYLEDIAAKKIINTDGIVTQKDIMLDMAEQKYSYCAPWQLFMLIDFFSDDANFGKKVSDNVEKAYEVFAPKFYGLKNSKGDFKYYAIKTVTVKRIVKRKVDGVWEEDISTTTTTEKTPLPYFDRIQAYDSTYDFTYKTEEKTNTTKDSHVTSKRKTTTITTTYTSIPVLKSTNVISNVDTFYTNLCSLIGIKNVDSFAECYSFLPYDSRLSLLLSELSSKGIISAGSGGVIAGGDYTLPSIILSNNTCVSKTEFIKVATSILGLPYFWGGKYHQEGINPNWWKATYCSAEGSSMSKGTWPLGLDCSGYVDWIFTQFGISVGGSTNILYQNGKTGVLTRVSKSNLQIGDIGLDYGSESIDGNHTGVVIGFKDGTPLIAHAGGSRYYGGINGQVVVSPLSETWNASHPVRFYAFYRVTGLTWK